MLAHSQTAVPRWRWIVFPAVTMSLGWALRGFIGGGPLGAMIPGAMVSLALCLLLRREFDSAFIAACGAVGIGFGGEMTYGQTVGLSFHPETYWWALTGFAVKGGAWGLLGGAVLGAGFSRNRYKPRDLAVAFPLILAGTWIGWKLINQPKLIYFSNPVDKPRPEVWAGLLCGALLFLAWLAWHGGAQLPARFAAWGALGGSLGFAGGAAIQVWGKNAFGEFPLGWWKVMELTFGALLGLAYGWCAWTNREALTDSQPEPAQPPSLRQSAAWAAVAIGLGILLEYGLKTRFNYVIAGTFLLVLCIFWHRLRLQTAVSLTVCAFALDLMEGKPDLPPAAMWTFVVVTTLATVLVSARRPRPFPMFLWVSWTAVGVSLLKSFLPLVSWKPLMMEALFLAMAMAITNWAICKEE
jgi:hypothetical protein